MLARFFLRVWPLLFGVHQQVCVRVCVFCAVFIPIRVTNDNVYTFASTFLFPVSGPRSWHAGCVAVRSLVATVVYPSSIDYSQTLYMCMATTPFLYSNIFANTVLVKPKLVSYTAMTNPTKSNILLVLCHPQQFALQITPVQPVLHTPNSSQRSQTPYPQCRKPQGKILLLSCRPQQFALLQITPVQPFLQTPNSTRRSQTQYPQCQNHNSIAQPLHLTIPTSASPIIKRRATLLKRRGSPTIIKPRRASPSTRG